MKAIADTGFLVAFLNSRDEHHDWAVRLAEQVTEPLLTCEAVLTEAAWLLNNVHLVLEVVASGLVNVEFHLTANQANLMELAARFADVQPDLCDLCVVRLSELFPEHCVITTDRRDFTAYRTASGRPIRCQFPTS